jgi:hypothetical protein
MEMFTGNTLERNCYICGKSKEISLIYEYKEKKLKE